MTCSRVQKLLSAYIDRELSQNETLVVRKHLISCSECNKILEGLTELKEQFDEINTVEPPPDLWANVQNAILAGELATDSRDGRQRFWANGFNFLKIIVPAVIIGIFISIPVISNITGRDIFSIFSGKDKAVVATVDTQTPDDNSGIVKSIGENLNTMLVSNSSGNNYSSHNSNGLSILNFDITNYTLMESSMLDFEIEFDYFWEQLFKELGLIQSYEFSLTLPY